MSPTATVESGNDPVGGGILTPLVIRDNPATPGPDTNYLQYTGDEHVVLGGTDRQRHPHLQRSATTRSTATPATTARGRLRQRHHQRRRRRRHHHRHRRRRQHQGRRRQRRHPGRQRPQPAHRRRRQGLHHPRHRRRLGSLRRHGQRLHPRQQERRATRQRRRRLDRDRHLGRRARRQLRRNLRAATTSSATTSSSAAAASTSSSARAATTSWSAAPAADKMAGMSGFDWATYKDDTLRRHRRPVASPIVFDEAPTPPPTAASRRVRLGRRSVGIALQRHAARRHARRRVSPIARAARKASPAARSTRRHRPHRRPAGRARRRRHDRISAGNIILGGDGSDIIEGRGGDDLIDGDKWLDVQIGGLRRRRSNHTGTPIELHNSMTTLVRPDVLGRNQSRPAGDRPDDQDRTPRAGDIDTPEYPGRGWRSTPCSATADGMLMVTRRGRESRSTARTGLRSIERLQFTDAHARTSSSAHPATTRSTARPATT